MEKTTFQSTTNALSNQFAAMLYEKSVLGTENAFHIFATSEKIAQLQKIINYQFSDLNLLFRAFTHRSFVHEYTKENLKNYERLEFLGDSVLGVFVTSKLFHKFNESKEGDLSRLKSSLVNEQKLFEIAEFLNMQDLILIGKGELLVGTNTSVISDSFEAMIGAISIDHSMTKAFEVLEYIISSFEKKKSEDFFSINNLISFDPKSKFQEECMRLFKCLPEYVTSKEGELFCVKARVNGIDLYTAKSISKKNATKEVAKYCLENKLLEKIENK